MKKITAFIVITFIYIASCNAQGITEMNMTNQQPTTNSETPSYIGEAWMEDNHEIVMQLFAEEDNGMSGQAQFRYKPDHPQYKDILKHLGGLKPGEKKGVLPWPAAN